MEIAETNTAYSQSYVGTVEESVAVSLSFSGAGTVEEVFVSEGQKVIKGQLLARLNTATAQSTYNAAEAKLAQAQDAYDRLTKVHNNGSLPDIKFVEVEAVLQQAKSMATITRKSLDDCKLYASRSGVIASRNIEVGTNVLPSVSAFKIVSIDKIIVKIPVPENEIGGISERQTADITVPALDNTVFTGKIEMKGISANAMSHTYEVKIGIDNPNETLLPGMVCKVQTHSDVSLQSKIVVPNSVIQISADRKHYVWLAVNDIAKRQSVETYEFTDNGIIVIEGLKAGDKVITEGFLKISEGTKVSIKN
jgi:RND family efflux transporter MFP subunit